MEEYNDDLLFLFSNESGNEACINLDKCSKEENYLICEIEKEEIEENLQYDNQIFEVYSHLRFFEIAKMDLIYNITIIDNIKQKKIIYVGITKILQEYINENNYITYETNVTDISNVVTGKFSIKSEKHGNIKCFLKKTPKDPLLFLCKWTYNYKDYIGEIKNENILYYSSIRYVFIIQPFKNNDNFEIISLGNIALFAYPRVIDFNLKEQYDISYINADVIKHESFKINLDSEIIESFNEGMTKICHVYRRHFENKKSGYYHTYHYLAGTGYSIIYEFSPIKVIIPNDNRVYIKIRFETEDEVRDIGYPGAICFSTFDNDYDSNIFNSSNIEDIEILPRINGRETSCILWKTKEKKN